MDSFSTVAKPTCLARPVDGNTLHSEFAGALFFFFFFFAMAVELPEGSESIDLLSRKLLDGGGELDKILS